MDGLSRTNLPDKGLDTTGTAVHLVECYFTNNLVAITPVRYLSVWSDNHKWDMDKCRKLRNQWWSMSRCKGSTD